MNHLQPRRPLFRAPVLFALFVVLFCAQASARQDAPAASPYRISYRLSMPEPKSHLFEVEIEVGGTERDGHVDFQMPRWSPGRYAVFDFAKNVQEVGALGKCLEAERCGSREFPVTRVDTQTWRVASGGSSEIKLSYKVFADDLSGTFSQLDERHANYNGHSVFMYVVGHKPDPVTLRILPPAGWRAVNGYTRGEKQLEWRFDNYDLLADSPTEVGRDWSKDSFKVEGKTYHVVIHASGGGGGANRPAFVRDVEKIVRAEVGMMGAPDLEEYTFLFHFDPAARRGDGMEHLTSTQIIETSAFDEEAARSALGTASHEFFHVWNVKRLRPAGLGPWDFTRPVVTRGLWVAEGLTNYYGKMFMRRAGLWTDEQLLASYAAAISEIENAPGSRLMSAEEASLLAPFLDRSTSDQKTNLANTSVSYYPKGETLGIVLDLLIRGRTRGRASLDDVMRRMYDEFYLNSPAETYYLKGRGFTPEDFERVASAVVTEAGGQDLRDFFARNVRATEPPPYEEALAAVGLRLVRRPDRFSFDAGITPDGGDSQSAVVGGVRTGSPAERAGLRQGDVLVQVGKAYVTSNSWRGALNVFRAGDRVPVTVRRARQTVQTVITLPVEPDTFDYRIEKAEEPPPEAVALRAAWLAGKNL